MAESAEECLARAAEAREAAAAEPLANARRKHLASADAWEALASRARGRAAVKAARFREPLPPDPLKGGRLARFIASWTRK